MTDFFIHRLVNRPVTSNCYLITVPVSDSCLVIDPGTEDCSELLKFLQEREWKPEYIIFTHEHVDHIIGAQTLQQHYPQSRILCSSNCATYMQLSKYNLTRMTEQWTERTSMPEANIRLEDIGYRMNWQGIDIRFYPAEGHSKGSIYFFIGDRLFTGDTLIKGYRTTTQLPGASREDLIATFRKMLEITPRNITVYSGHFEPFCLQEAVDEITEQIDFFEKKISQKRK